METKVCLRNAPALWTEIWDSARRLQNCSQFNVQRKTKYSVCGFDWQKVKQCLICRHRICNHRGMLASHRPTWEAALSRKASVKGAIRLLITGVRGAVSVTWLLMRVSVCSFHQTRAGSVQRSFSVFYFMLHPCLASLIRASTLFLNLSYFLFTEILLREIYTLSYWLMSGATFTYPGHSVAGVIWFWVYICMYVCIYAYPSLLFTMFWE